MSIPLLANIDLKRVLKIGGITLAALILISLAVTFVSSTVRTVSRKGGVSSLTSGGLGGGDRFGMGGAIEKGSTAYDSARGMAQSAPSLSVRNIAPIPPINDGGSTGSDAESYEVTQYRGTIETRRKDDACNALFALKAKDYVIFEQANTYDKGCNVTFKVIRDRVDEVVAIVKSMAPKEFIENTHTIKRQIEDFTGEIAILQRKQAVIEDTLNQAMAAYDEITALAKQTRNPESLASVITSKIQTIERLTNERINISNQLDRLTRAKAEQLDKLEYTYFYLDVFENKYLDGQQLKDSWKAAIRAFVREVNNVAQDISVNLITLLLRGLQYLLYAFIVLIVAKHAWQLAKRIWRGPVPPPQR